LSTNSSSLSLSYDLNSPIFKELLSILSNNSINQETPVKIEHFLQNQANQALELESNKLKLNTNESSSTFYSYSYLCPRTAVATQEGE